MRRLGRPGQRSPASRLAAIEAHNQRCGLATLCIGGGEATAMAVELVE